MKRSLLLEFLLFIFILSSTVMIQAADLTVEGLGKTNYYLYDDHLNSIGSAKTNDTIEVTAGAYIIKLNNCYKKILIQETENNVIIKTGSISVSGSGLTNYYVYRDERLSYIASKQTNDKVELFPGNYIVKLNKIFKVAIVSEGQETHLKTGSLEVIGTGLHDYKVYDINMNESLVQEDTNDEVELFPGNYILMLNKTTKNAKVEGDKKTIVKSGNITVTGTGETNYYVYYDSDSTNTIINEIDNNERIGLPNAINALKIVSGMDGIPISLPSYIFFNNSDYLKSQTTNQQVELFPGDYLLKMNKTFHTANVKESQNTIIRSGTVSVSGNGSTTFYVYDLYNNNLNSAVTNRKIELFPGEYTLKLNNIRQNTKVIGDQNTIVRSGTINVSGDGSSSYYVYDSNNIYLKSTNTNRQIELFPGNYYLKLLNTFQTATVTADQTLIVKTGFISISANEGNYYIHDVLYYNSLTSSSANKSIYLFPGEYIVKYNNSTQIVDVKKDQESLVTFY